MSKLPIHRAAKPKIKDKITRGLDFLPEIEIIRPYRGYPVGAIIRPYGVLRSVLIDNKIARLVESKDVEKNEIKTRSKKSNTKEEIDVRELVESDKTDSDEASE